jgi:hypothetical protein
MCLPGAAAESSAFIGFALKQRPIEEKICSARRRISQISTSGGDATFVS